MITVGVKLTSKVNRGREEIAAVGWYCHYSTLAIQPEKLSKGDFKNINKESRCDEGGDVPEGLTQAKKFTLKKLSKLFHDAESVKDRIWETDPNLERNMIIF